MDSQIENSVKYGFAVCDNTIDNAKMCRSSMFAKAMGMNFDDKVEYTGDCEWYV